MKKQCLFEKFFIAVAVALLSLGSQAFAQNSTWVPTAAGTGYTWGNATNWTSTVPNTGGAVANINNNIAGAQTITLSGPTTVGMLNFGDSDGTNTFNVTANTLTFQGANAGDATYLTISTAGTVTNTISSAVVLGGTSPLTVTNNGGQMLSFTGGLNTGTNTITFDTSNTGGNALLISTNGLSGNGALIKNGKGNLLVSSNSTYTGTVTINSGIFTIAGGSSGSIDSTSFTINGNAQAGVENGGSELFLGSNTAAKAGGRLSDSAVITMNGGGFYWYGSSAAGVITSETIGGIVAGEGNSNLTLNAGGTTQTELQMTSLTRSASGTIQVRGNLLGSAAGTAASSRIFITTALPLIGGNGAAGTKNMSVLPWAIGGTNKSNENAELMTYTAASGLRPLASGEYNTMALAATTDNVVDSVSGVTVDKTINALKYNNSGSTSITAGKTLTLTSGALVFANNGGIIAGGTLNFGAEGVIFSYSSNTNTISSTINGTAGVTKGGTGTLVLSGSNIYAGATTISGGVLKAGAVNTLPSNTAVVLANTTTNTLTGGFINTVTALDLNSLNQTIGSLAGGGTFGGNVLLGSATLTTGGSNASTIYGGIISGVGGGLTKAGSGVFTVTGANTYTGATTVSTGTLLVSGTGSVNTSSGVSVTGGTFKYDSSVGLSRNVTVSGGRFSYNSASNYTGALTFTSGSVGGSNLAGVALSIGTGQTMAPGNSTGALAAGATTWTNGGTFVFEINDATGAEGSTSAGWDLLNASSLNITAGSGQFTMQLVSLNALQAAGQAQNFSDGTSYSWLFVDAGASITGFSASQFVLDATAFQNPHTGNFSISQGIGVNDDKLYINYTAVPEPATWALLAFSLTTVMVLRRRRA
jgi:autotransporter-associated beta strand protein